MKKLRLLTLACVTFASIASFTNTYAATHANSGTIFLGAGYDFLSSKREMQNPTMPLFGLGYNFTNHWGIEAILGTFNTKFNNSLQDFRQVNGTLFSVDGLYHFSPYYHETIEPFAMLGVGILGLSPNRTNDANNEGNINAGLGVNFYAHHMIALRLEARDFYTAVGGKNDIMIDGGINISYDFC